MRRGEIGLPLLGSFEIGLAVLISALFLLAGCSKTEKPLVEASPPPVKTEASPPPATAQAAQPQQISKLPPAQTTEVEQAVKRVFKEAALVDTTYQPAFIVGDFNGDLSQDIAVMLKPAPDKLSALNEEFPNWMLRDLGGSAPPASPRLRVAANDKLLAIIHGYDARGWRDDQATQTYLLKNGAGPGMETYSAKEFVAAYKGSKMPQLRGDVMGQEIGGKLKCIYFAGATYSWYDPKTFNDEPERRMVHMGPRKPKG
jgi:hypothetical protein